MKTRLLPANYKIKQGDWVILRKYDSIPVKPTDNQATYLGWVKLEEGRNYTVGQSDWTVRREVK